MGRKFVHLTGRQAYFSDSIMRARIANLTVDQKSRPYSYRRIMSLHAERWQNLSRERRDMYERQAQAMQGERAEARDQELGSLSSEIVAAKCKQQTELEQKNPSMCLSSCRLSISELQSWGSLAGTESFSDKEVTKHRLQVQKSPKPVSEQWMQQNAQKSQLSGEPSDTHSGVTAAVSKHRDYFAKSVFVLEKGPMEWEFYRFLFATQRPITVHMLYLTLTELSADYSAPTSENWQTRTFQDFSFVWSYSAESIESCDILGTVAPERLGFLKTSIFKGPGILVTRDHIEPLLEVLEGLKEEEVGPVKAPRPASSSASSKPPMNVPAWVGRALQQSASSPSSSSPSPLAPSQPHSTEYEHVNGGDPLDGQDHSSYEVAFQELEDQRLDLKDEHDKTGSDFFSWNLMGGDWSVHRAHREVWGIRVSVRRNTELDEFARAHGLALSASFDDEVYTRNGASELAQLWQSRMMQIMNTWIAAGRPSTCSGLSVPQLAPDERQEAIFASFSQRAQTRLNRILTLLP